eukprot:c23414_g1_i1 orf=121-414(+)
MKIEATKSLQTFIEAANKRPHTQQSQEVLGSFPCEKPPFPFVLPPSIDHGQRQHISNYVQLGTGLPAPSAGGPTVPCPQPHVARCVVPPQQQLMMFS